MNCKTLLFFLLLFGGGHFFANGQGFCPTNIDFELGTTANWNYFKGTVSGTATAGPVYALTSSPAISGWHTLTSGVATDHYGLFPIVAPGSGAYSLKLGHDTTNSVAERALYYVHIPAGTTTYSLVYHYAVVLENPTTAHTANQMPRLVVDAYDSATTAPVPCISYTYIASSALPGFTHSTVTSTVSGNGTDVYYKPWTTGNMKFPGLNGHTVAVEFTANGCTPGGHFGYGYVDMSCGLFAISTLSCGTSTATVSAPPGYSFYHWYDSTTFATSYGTTSTVTLTVPITSTTYAVVCTPYTGYGCPDTLYTRLVPTNLATTPSHDTAICAGSSVTLSSNATDISLPLSYSWSPPAGLSCTACATAVATPTATTAYSVTTTDAGGCLHNDVINVTVYSNPAVITGPAMACIGTSTTLTDAVSGGRWTSSNTFIATIGSVSGIVGGVTSGSVNITYSFGSGLCAAYTAVSVSPLPASIDGITSVCAGSATTLSDVTGPGTWSSSNTSVATVGFSTGIVGGVLSGTSVITYTAVTGCSKTVIVTVNPLPASISGVTTVCAGATTPLSDGGGGTWGSNNTSIATVAGSTGLVSGVAGGSVLITYTLPTSCFITTAVAVNAAPLPVTGTMNVCLGTTALLSDGTGGGTWASSNTFIASISSSGVVSGFNPGPVIISYTAPGGCQAFATITVNPFPDIIAGVSGLCAGTTAAMFDAGGGTWSSSDLSIATVNATTGIVTGVGPSGGTDTIIYTLPTGCSTTTALSVFALPSPITDSISICIGSTTTLSDPTPFGIWISGNEAVAAIDIFTGNISGVTTGTATISYILSSGCQVTSVATVNPSPYPVTGPNMVCVGASVNLDDASAGGTWSSSDAGIASIDIASGIVTGGAPAVPASLTMTYTLPTGCSVLYGVTVYTLPPPIGGVSHICIGQSAFLTDATGGGTWTAGNGNATIVPALGVLTGVSPGTDTIAYTVGTGCSVTTIITVNSSPGAITGNPFVCAGGNTALSDVGSGTWTSSSISIATIGFSTGVVSGVISGTSIITFSQGGSCVSAIIVTVNALPSLLPVTGGGSYCAGGAGVHIFCGSSGAAISYQLYSGGVPIGSPLAGTGATIDFGLQTAAGIYTVVATNMLTGCSRSMTGSATITINSSPGLHSITGGGSYCTGGTGLHLGLDGSEAGAHYQLYYAGTSLGSAITGTGSAIDFGLMTGTGTYTVVATSSITGCVISMPGGVTIAANPLPAAYSVTGGAAYCAGGTIPHVFLSGSAPGISYQLFNGTAPAGAAVAGTGSILDFGPHAAAGTYTVVATNTATTCSRTMTGSAIVTINPIPAISGPTAVCVGASITETVPGLTGGTWGSSALSVATVSLAGGIVYGVLTGSTATITYTSTAGCTATTIVNVSSSPGPVLGPSIVCQGSSVKDSDIVTGGSWASSNIAVATTGAFTGMIYGIATGSVTITYSLGSGCTVTKIMTVTAAPAAITGVATMCMGTSTHLSDATPAGTWGSSNTGIATVVPATGIVWGVAAGTAIINYTAGACSSSVVVTVNSTPAAITGPAVVCAGLAITEVDAITGGSWVSGTSGVATIDPASGIASGIDPGTSTITYSLGGPGCSATKVITVTVAPVPIIGPTGLCLGATTLLSESVAGGTWSSSSFAVATVSSTGVVNGLSIGTATIIYSIGGCSASIIMTINPAPTAITGVSNVCTGSVGALSDLIGGGTWTSSNTLIATVDGSGGIWGVAPGGIAAITYSLGGSCVVTKTITVNPIAPIAGSPGVCVGATTNLSDAAIGGTWSSSASLVATISGTGIVHGSAPGTTTITYTTSTGCMAMVIVTVNTAPSAIAGIMHVCAGSCAPLSDLAGGGSWSCSSGIATINPVSGLVCGVSAGTATVSYSLGFGCTISAVLTVNPIPSVITGTTHVCVGLSTSLSTVTAGGAWSSSVTSVAAIDPATGGVSGLLPGTAMITYSLPTGCSVTTTITVDPLPQAITGSLSLCAGSTATLADLTSGGAWSSANTGIAAIDIVTGIVSAVAPGPVAIAYTLPTGCAATGTITVNSAPPSVTGSTSICISAATALSDAVSGGAWSSGNSLVAAVTPAGVVNGVAAGTSAISYTVGGCPVVVLVTVNSLPDAITGNTRFCVGSSSAFTDLPGGGTWSISPAIATIDETAGVVTGTSAGTAIVFYSLGIGCTVSTTVTVDALPAPITGVSQVCLGYTTTLGDASGGGAWSSSNAAIAAVTAGGIVTGTGGGPATISYTNTLGCSAARLTTVIAVPSILGIGSMCAFSTPLNLYDSAAGGFWTSTVASISLSGVVTPYSAGLATITYTLPLGCFTTAALTINPIPGPVTGASHLCTGTSMTLSDTTAGGTWHSSNTAVAPVSSGGIVTAVLPGTATISYIVASGCMTNETITVFSHPSLISGTANVCQGTTAAWIDSVAGGAWSSSNPSVADISGSGIITASSPGVAAITYSLASSCATTKLITVNPLPAIFTVTGGGGYCDGAAGVHIGLSGSNVGITYLLYYGGAVISAISGTGTAPDFGLQTAVGTYTVSGTNTSTTCANDMTGGATVSAIPVVVPEVSVAGTAGDSICAGMPVTFTATPLNGGSSPAYEWTVNGLTAGTGATSYSYIPVDHDIVNVRLVSNATCASPDTVNNSVTMTVVTPPVLVINVTADPGTTIKTGDSILFATNVTNGSPLLTFQWVVNATPIPGATLATYSNNNFADGDSVSCMITSTGFCDLAGSGWVKINIDNNVSVKTLAGGGGISVTPNPNKGIFIIKGSTGNTDHEVMVEITDMLGQVVYKDNITAENGKINGQIILGNTVANGMYILSLRSGSENKAFHIVVEQ